MKIEFFTSCAYTRPLVVPLITSQNIITSGNGVYLCLREKNGANGYGEVNGSNDRLQLAQLSNIIDREIPNTLDGISDFIDETLLDLQPAYRFAIETALCDLAAKIADKPLAEWINPKCHNKVPVNYLLSSLPLNWDKFRDIILKRGYKAVKIKIGSGTKEDEIEFIARIRKYLGEDIEIRLDANRAMDYDRAASLLTEAAPYDISYIEEPLNCFNMALLTRLRKEADIGIALDESLIEENYNPILLDQKYCDAAIIKPALTGGVKRTIDFYEQVKKTGIRPVITSNLETEIGLAASLHLTAATSGELTPMGLDTLRFYDKADRSLTALDKGMIKINLDIGLGDWSNLCQPMA